MQGNCYGVSISGQNLLQHVMELLSEKFENAVQQVLNSSKLVIGTIHYKAHHSLVKQIKSRKDTDIVKVTFENRIHLPFLIANKAIKFRLAQN